MCFIDGEQVYTMIMQNFMDVMNFVTETSYVDMGYREGIDADDVGSPRWPYSRKAFSKMPGLIGVATLQYSRAGSCRTGVADSPTNMSAVR